MNYHLKLFNLLNFEIEGKTVFKKVPFVVKNKIAFLSQNWLNKSITSFKNTEIIHDR